MGARLRTRAGGDGRLLHGRLGGAAARGPVPGHGRRGGRGQRARPLVLPGHRPDAPAALAGHPPDGPPGRPLRPAHPHPPPGLGPGAALPGGGGPADRSDPAAHRPRRPRRLLPPRPPAHARRGLRRARRTLAGAGHGPRGARGGRRPGGPHRGLGRPPVRLA
ncbi:hypothetical protein SGPA1_60060 [Streptomyces misionensis JCM 4497]